MTKHRSRKLKGGNSPSGWGYVYNTVGNGWTQFQNALTLQPGQNLASQQSNDIEPIGKPNFQNTESMPSKTDLTLIQSAGKRRHRKKKGGNWGAIISRAAAPLTLLGLQKSFGKRKSRRSRKGGNFSMVASQAAVPLTLLGLQNTFKKRKGSRGSRKMRRSRKRL